MALYLTGGMEGEVVVDAIGLLVAIYVGSVAVEDGLTRLGEITLLPDADKLLNAVVSLIYNSVQASASGNSGSDDFVHAYRNRESLQ